MNKKTALKTLFVFLLIAAIMQTGTAYEGKLFDASNDGYHQSCFPTPQPTHTAKPTPNPTVTVAPTPVKTPKPTPVITPTAQPTEQPTVAPTVVPTVAPTAVPTVAPTAPPVTNPGNNQVLSFGGSSGGGACGRDVHSDEPLSNTIKHETNEEFVSIYKKSIDYKFKTLEFLKGAGFIPNSTENCVSAQGELLKGRSANTKPLEAKGPIVFFNVWIGGIGYSDSPKVRERYILFDAPDELKEKREISLMLFKNGSWKEIPFERNEGHFVAKVPAFGYYALTEKASSPAAVNVSTVPLETSPVKKENKTSDPYFWQAVAVIVAAFLLLFAALKFNEKRPK